MVGRKMTSVVNYDDRELHFTAEDGSTFVFLHHQDCCENVYIEDVCGDLHDLVGSEILVAEEIENTDVGFTEEDNDDGVTRWTFYRFVTHKGTVTVRWCGSSNGYYSVSVSLEETLAKKM
jgi:hypothetical protein